MQTDQNDYLVAQKSFIIPLLGKVKEVKFFRFTVRVSTKQRQKKWSGTQKKLMFTEYVPIFRYLHFLFFMIVNIIFYLSSQLNHRAALRKLVFFSEQFL